MNRMISIIMASIIDFILGDPYSFPHPVKLMGRIISMEEDLGRRITHSGKVLKLWGFIMSIVNITLAFIIPLFILKVLRGYMFFYHVFNVYLIYTCIAARCLHKEAVKVVEALDDGLEEGRKRLSYIVGRETDRLSEEEILRATVETVAENTSDGVLAPLLYMMILGAPGGIVYKMVNTMDSMLGYKNDKYRDLGYFPAKIDDVFNYIPARLTGILMNLSSIFRFDVARGFKIMLRDRKNHSSPNAIYPEGAVAGLLGIELGGHGYYSGKLIKKPTIGDPTKSISKGDVRNTIRIMYSSEILMIIFYSFGYFLIK